MNTRSYAAVIVALTYGHVYGYVPSPGLLSSALDDLGALDVYADDSCPATVRCPVTERPIHVVCS